MAKETFQSKYSAGFAPQYESEGSGSSGHIHSTEDSTALLGKWVDLNSASRDGFAIPIQIVPLSKMSAFERKNLAMRLASELEQIRHLQKKVEFQERKLANPGTLSSSSDMLSGTKAQNKGLLSGSVKKSSGPVSGAWKKGIFPNRSVKGSAEQANLNLNLNPHSRLLKQCESLLKKLMSQQYAWVFNTPVDSIKLNIPDYFNIIKYPMDLGTVKSKLTSAKYSNPLEFLSDVRLTFSNAKTYNPPGTDVHFMADTMSHFFELRWKAIEKKLVTNSSSAFVKSEIRDENGTAKAVVSSNKKESSPNQNELKQPTRQKMSDEEKHKLGVELEELMSDLPDNIIDFLKGQCSGGGGEDEIEIDIDDLSNDTLFTLRKLLDDHLQEKQKNRAKSNACEMELPNVSGPSNSSLQADKEDNDDVDICGNEAPVTSYPPPQTHVDAGRTYTEAGLESTVCDKESECPESAFPQKTEQDDVMMDATEGAAKLVDGHGEIVQIERPVSPDKLYRAALLKNRFADIILKAQEKTLGQDDKGDPEKVRREREELEMHKKREKARLQAEAKAAEDARRQAEAEAAAELKRRRELEREAAREALLKMEKTVEINENYRFDEDQSHDEFGHFNFKGSNPLEQLGLYMKVDEEDDEGEARSISKETDDIEAGEID